MAAKAYRKIPCYGEVMILSLDKRLLFIKGVKVGGSSVEIYMSSHLEESAVVTPMSQIGADAADFGMLWRPRNYQNAHGLIDFYDHIPATSIRSVIGTWLYESLFKFSIVRNPYDKIRSLYYMNVAVQGSAFTIDEAISRCDTEALRICDGGSPIVHKIITYENLDEELNEVFSIHGIPFDGRLAINARSKPRKMYRGPDIVFSKEQKEIIREKFAFEFNLYNQRHMPIE